ncbi:MAG: hypothetical protein H6687_00765 [Bacillales bacterium]|nr:hypothetical protein [Bacillales bacterium]
MKNAFKFFAAIFTFLSLIFFAACFLFDFSLWVIDSNNIQQLLARDLMNGISFILFPIVLLVIMLVVKIEKKNSQKEEVESDKEQKENSLSSNKTKVSKVFKYAYIFFVFAVFISFILCGTSKILIRFNVVNNESFILFIKILSYISLIALLILILVSLLLLYKKEGRIVTYRYIKKQFSFIENTYSIPYHFNLKSHSENYMEWENENTGIGIRWSCYEKLIIIIIDDYYAQGYTVGNYEKEFECADRRYDSKVKYAANWLRESIESGKINIKIIDEKAQTNYRHYNNGLNFGERMTVKKISEHDSNYADYIITDGKYDLRCMCISLPLPLNKKTKIGMEVTTIFCFCYKGIQIKKINEEKDKHPLIKKEKGWFHYKLRGKIINAKKSLVSIYGFTISLEYDFENGLPKEYKDDDYIEFMADRLDAKLIDS